ncbi:MAG: hypothetical protein JXQ29_06055, partial [Planctomycetes bacterium]|nr:hypothetical protein [Planctomycetota bacterium]
MTTPPLAGSTFLGRCLLLAGLGAVLVAGTWAPPPAAAQGTPIGFPEDFALAADRAAVLKQLVPGSEDYYFYQCLLKQHVGAFDEVKPLLETWIQRHGRTPRVLEIENRQALLLVDRDPAATYALLRERLGLRFDAQRQARGEKPDLPTALDPELIAPRNLLRRALAQHRGSLDGLRDSALESMAGASLTDDLLMSLLGRLRRPDLPNLPALIARNLDHPRSRGFGSLPIHRNLLLEQLEELVQLRPKLLAESALIEVWLPRLKPSADLRWSRDLEAREAYLDRLWIFAQRLPPAHNSLKAHVLYARLAHDLEAGKPSPERFLAYLRLPRPGTYVNPDHIRRTRAGTEVVDANRDFPTELGRIGNDEPLVRAYLQHFFQSEDAYAPYAEFVREDYLRRLFAETKILLGTGDMERWYSLLDDPAYYEQLKERVEILFAPTQRRHFAAEEPVAIDVDVKNVETLLVKVFVIDTFDFHREKKAEVDARIDLDGMIANEEKTYTYGESPFRRVRRHFDFPSLREPGTYVVEFLGNGLSSRAVIEKGRLQYTERVGVAGHVFRVLDEAGQHRRAASIWFDGRSFAADDRGEINVPFGAKNETRDLVLHHGRLSTRARFEHRAETYQLDAGIVVDREALLAGGKARILVRPSLRVAGVPASLALLKEPELTITAVDLEGVASNLVVRDLALAADRDLVHEIRVPENLVELTAALRGKVESLSEGKTIPLESPTASFALSRIDATAETACPLLGRTAEGYVLDLLGKNGEPKPDRAVQLQLQHRDFTDVVHVTLKTDARGRIRLGPLPGIVSLRTSGFPAEIGAFTLEAPPRAWPESLHGAVGTTLHVPYPGRAGAPARSDLSLLEVRGDTFARDAFSHLAVAEGFVELRELPAGDYDLWLKGPDRHIAVRVAAGASRDGWVIGRDRLLELAARAPLHIVNLSTAENHLEVQLANATPHTRVHLFATRYLEPYDPLTGIAVAPGPEARWALVDHAESSYHAGREIGDEYRYILDRRYARKYPGNMLRRPGLLLNPWALDETATALGLDGGAGGAFGGRRGGVGRRYGGEGGVARAATSTAPGIFPNLDFLPEAAPTLANLRPDAAGRVRVPLADLGPGQLVHVLAVDRQDSTYASLPMAERPFTPRDRSLTAGLDPDRHFAEQRRIEFVRAGTAAVIDDVTTARTEIYDSLAGVFRLLQTLSGNSDLKTFAFLLRWPELAAAERRELYSRHACHELHFFLYQKDRPFFDEVVRPYLASKAHKTFLDQWLLGADLGAYLEPWKFARLNIVERILLARRLAGQADSGARHVRELLEMVRPDPERAAFLFATALRSGALDASRAPSLAEAEKKLKSEDRDAPESARPPGAPAPSRLARLKDARKAEAPADKMA